MNAPTEEGAVGRGVRVTIEHHEGYLIEPDDSMPAAVTARVVINGLLAGKASVSLDGWKDISDEQAIAEAIRYAWAVAERRMTKWRRGLEQWEALSSS